MCSSDFVTDSWITYLDQIGRGSNLRREDFLMTSRYTFRALASLCSLMNRTIENSLTRFYARDYVTIDLTSRDAFVVQLKSQIDEFWQSTINEFFSSLQITQNITQTNILLSSLLLNSMFFVNGGFGVPMVSIKTYGSCSCGLSAWCIDSSYIYDSQNNNAILLKVQGMYMGCYVFESLLQSTLQCFYDQPCFSNLTATMSTTIRPNATILNASVASHYSRTSTVGELLKELMVEEWNWTMMYERYYETCAPSECRYTVKTRNDAIYIVTTMIGLIGGLNTALKLIVPHTVQFIRYLRGRRQTPVVNIAVVGDCYSSTKISKSGNVFWSVFMVYICFHSFFAFLLLL